MKKILYLHASAELYGSDRVLLNLILSLDKNRYYPIVVLPFFGPLADELLRHNIECKIMKIPVLRRELLSVKGVVQYTLSFFFSFIRLTYLLFSNSVSIIHTNTSAVLIGGFISCITRRKHIWQVMEIIESPHWLAYFIAKTVGTFSTEVFCISNAVRSYFIRYSKLKKAQKFKTLYHGVDLDEYNYSDTNRNNIRNIINVDDECIVVGFIGRLNAWKGQDIFVDAAKKCLMQAGNLKLHFVIIGSCFEGQEKYRIRLEEELFKEKHLKKHLSLFDFQTNIHEWLSAIDIFVLPSKLPEPNATIVLAAMATAIPVIGTDIGGTPETVINNVTGLLIAPNDSDSLCDKILYLCRNDGIRKSMGNEGLARVRSVFSLGNYNSTIQKAYE